jgi:HK97 family phage major capsid protein
VTEREQTLDTIDQVLSQAEEEERDPSTSELELVRRNRERISELEPQITELLEVEETRQRASETHGVLLRATGGRAPAGGAAPAPEAPGEPVYRSFAQYARDALITRVDRIGQIVGPELRQRAAERLERAAAVHTLTSDVPGLIPDQHIAQIFETINTARPVVASSRQIGLSSGKLTWPSVTGRPTVAKQVTEKTNPAYSNMTVTMREVVADTYLGAGNLSWQTINWSSPDALRLFFDLMAEAYAEQTESAACTVVDTAAAAGGTVGSDDLAGWMAAIAAAAGLVKAAGGRANAIYLDGVTGYHLLGLVAVENPVFLTVGPGSLGDASGNMGGLRFVVSDGFAASTAIVGDSTKLLCAETPGAPVEMRAVEPSIGGLEVGVIGAFAAVAALPGAFVQLTPPVTTLAASASKTSK